jgi:carbon storage regulator
MLVLSRKLGEKIHIGNDITLTVVSIMGNRVQLGLEAPDNVCILRGELLSRQATPEIGSLAGDEDLHDKPDCWRSTASDNPLKFTDSLIPLGSP